MGMTLTRAQHSNIWTSPYSTGSNKGGGRDGSRSRGKNKSRESVESSSGRSNPMGGPNFWTYSCPADYTVSKDAYQSPMNYTAPFQYGPPSGGGGGRWGGMFGGGGQGDGGGNPKKAGWVAAFVYAALGLVGYLVAGSTMSLIGGLTLSTPFVASSALMGVNPSLGAGLGLVFSVLVLAYCAKKFHKSKKLVPGGVLFGFSAWTLLAYLRFFLKF